MNVPNSTAEQRQTKMKATHLMKRRMIVLAGLIMVILFASCGKDTASTDAVPHDGGEGTGSLAFRVTWINSTAAGAAKNQDLRLSQAEEDICTTGVVQVTASVYNQADELLTDGGPWACEAHQGVIGSVPVGDNRKLVVLSLDGSGNILHRGELSGIPVAEGIRYEVPDPVECYTVIPALLSPSDNSSVSDAGLRFEWSLGQQANIESYQIQISTVADFSTTVADTTVAATYYEPTDPLIGSFYWRVRSIDKQGKTGVWSGASACTVSSLRYIVTAGNSEGGSIAPSGENQVVPGSSLTLSISPNTGYHIQDVLVDDVSQGSISGYNFENVSADHTIQATFAINTYTLSASRSPEAGGSITSIGDTTVNYGTSRTYTITVNDGYYLSELLVDGSAVDVDGLTYTFGDISDDHTILAIFRPVVFVAASGDNSEGSTWETAYHSIQTAVLNANSGDDIWIKAGDYGLSSQLTINKSVLLYGGFAGDETHHDQRDWELNQTRIDGQNNTRCMDIIGADSQFNGLTIYRGQITGGDPGTGGGVYIQGASPVFVNCAFVQNGILSSIVAQGGAVFVDSGNPQFQDCTFTDNYVEATSVSDGGAMYVKADGVLITGCIFERNYTDGDSIVLGGAIYSYSTSTMGISDCRFINNEARSDMADMCGGGAVYLANSSELNRCVFQGNQADGGMGHGGALYITSSPFIQNCLFAGNQAAGNRVAQGGAIFNSGGSPEIINATFADNFVTGGFSAADNRGGGISNYNASPIIQNCIFWGNTADTNNQIYNNAGSASTVEYCDIDEAGYVGDDRENIREDPLFGSSYHLRADSPCIDSGLTGAAPEVDLDNEIRPVGTVVDIGADEFMDTDRDQMPDFWENQYSLDRNSDDSDGDPDSDSLPNLFEYQYDTSPVDKNAVVKVGNRGWWDEGGNHNADVNSVIVGEDKDNAYRGYLIFNLTGVSSGITSAILRIEIAGYNSSDSLEPVRLYDVSTSATTLENSGSGRTDIYSDLGSGAAYGYTDITSAMVGTSIGIRLSDQAVSDLNAAAGGYYSIGLRAPDYTGGKNETVLLGEGDEVRNHQLILFSE